MSGPLLIFLLAIPAFSQGSNQINSTADASTGPLNFTHMDPIKDSRVLHSTSASPSVPPANTNLKIIRGGRKPKSENGLNEFNTPHAVNSGAQGNLHSDDASGMVGEGNGFDYYPSTELGPPDQPAFPYPYKDTGYQGFSPMDISAVGSQQNGPYTDAPSASQTSHFNSPVNHILATDPQPPQTGIKSAKSPRAQSGFSTYNQEELSNTYGSDQQSQQNGLVKSTTFVIHKQGYPGQGQDDGYEYSDAPPDQGYGYANPPAPQQQQGYAYPTPAPMSGYSSPQAPMSGYANSPAPQSGYSPAPPSGYSPAPQPPPSGYSNNNSPSPSSGYSNAPAPQYGYPNPPPPAPAPPQAGYGYPAPAQPAQTDYGYGQGMGNLPQITSPGGSGPDSSNGGGPGGFGGGPGGFGGGPGGFGDPNGGPGLPPPPPPPLIKGSIDYILIPLILIGIAAPVFVVVYVVLGSFEAKVAPVLTRRSLTDAARSISSNWPVIEDLMVTVSRSLDGEQCWEKRACNLGSFCRRQKVLGTTWFDGKWTKFLPEGYQRGYQAFTSGLSNPTEDCSAFKCS